MHCWLTAESSQGQTHRGGHTSDLWTNRAGLLLPISSPLHFQTPDSCPRFYFFMCHLKFSEPCCKGVALFPHCPKICLLAEYALCLSCPINCSIIGVGYQHRGVLKFERKYTFFVAHNKIEFECQGKVFFFFFCKITSSPSLPTMKTYKTLRSGSIFQLCVCWQADESLNLALWVFELYLPNDLVKGYPLSFVQNSDLTSFSSICFE